MRIKGAISDLNLESRDVESVLGFNKRSWEKSLDFTKNKYNKKSGWNYENKFK